MAVGAVAVGLGGRHSVSQYVSSLVLGPAPFAQSLSKVGAGGSDESVAAVSGREGATDSFAGAASSDSGMMGTFSYAPGVRLTDPGRRGAGTGGCNPMCISQRSLTRVGGVRPGESASWLMVRRAPSSARPLRF